MLRRPPKIPKVSPEEIVKKWKIVSGDKVQVISGKEAGKIGTIKKVIRKSNQVLIEGVNLVKKHVASKDEFKGGIFSIESPLHISKVLLVDPKYGVGTRIGYKYLEDGQKVRISKISGAIIEKPGLSPDYIKKKKERERLGIGIKDTPVSISSLRTYTQTLAQTNPSAAKSIEDLD